ncbi:MAG: anion permease [Deltaproteobacteria bacterium]|nr:anion permease [Deltaproteobacteria bacterium]
MHVQSGFAGEPKLSWRGVPGFKPILLIIGFGLFILAVLAPAPQSLLDLVTKKAPPGYKLDRGTETIAETVNRKLRPEAFKAYQAQKEGKTAATDKPHVATEEGAHEEAKPLMTAEQVAFLAKLMVLLLLLCAFLWGTESLPIGATDLLVAVIMYVFAVMPINDIARAYMQDAVFFIFGILAVAVGVSKTGLDKRIGLILLRYIKGPKAFAFIFYPAISVSASFLSEHALVALLIPVLMGVYKVTCRMYGVEKDRALALFLVLGMCFAANHGGPGSPAAGGRNAIMVGYLAAQGTPISFGDWMKYGMPFVPVAAACIGFYMYLVLKPKFKVKTFNPSEVVLAEVKKMGKLRGREALMAVILVALVVAWVVLGEHSGLGGPTLYAVMAMFLGRIITWSDVQSGVAFDVVGLYAASCAMGVGLSFTGGALWMAHAFVGAMPDFLTKGDNLAIGVSLLSGTITNFMSDGATVAALGPIVLPMATIADVHAWKVGLATAFASSFANALVVGTPNNAIAFSMCRDPETGERLMEVTDFIKYGVAVVFIAWAVLWFWAILGYWQFLSWPAKF